MTLSVFSLRRKLISLSSALVTSSWASCVVAVNLVVSLKRFSTLVVYSCLSRITVPLPLSGLVIVMEASDLRSLSARICEGGSLGMVCLWLENSEKEVWAVLEICCDSCVQFMSLSLGMGLGFRL